MGVYVALGAAEVEADSPEEVIEAVKWDGDLDWRLRHICTATEWVALQSTGARPWIGKASFVALPMLLYGMATGNNFVWAAAGWVASSMV